MRFIEEDEVGAGDLDDFEIAADHAQFGLPEPLVGLAALGGGGLQRLVRQVPMKQAMRLALTGKRVGAEEALRMGLINEVVAAGHLLARAGSGRGASGLRAPVARGLEAGNA